MMKFEDLKKKSSWIKSSKQDAKPKSIFLFLLKSGLENSPGLANINAFNVFMGDFDLEKTVFI